MNNSFICLISFQAIAIAGCFMNEGSILVVCPAVLRYSWAEELEHWLPFCLPADIHLGNTFSPYISFSFFFFLFVDGRKLKFRVHGSQGVLYFEL